MKIDLNKRFFHEKGFTLLELMVAIAIIAILSTVVIAMTSKARARGRDGQRYSDIRQINNAIQLYIAANGRAPDMGAIDAGESQACAYDDGTCGYAWSDLQADLSPTYISKLPVDPCGSSCNTGQIYYDSDGNEYMRIFRYEYVWNPGGASSSSYILAAASLETKDTYRLPGFEISNSLAAGSY